MTIAPRFRARWCALGLTALLAAGCATSTAPVVPMTPATPAAATAPIRVKVFVAAMFEIGQNTGDRAGEFQHWYCLLYTSPSPRDGLLSRMPSSA